MPNLAIKNTPIENLIPYASNSRTHSDEQVAQIAASIKEPWRFCVENDCYAAGESGTVYRVCRRQMSRAGNVISKYETIALSGSIDKYGYRTYRISVDGIKRHLKGHRIVAGAFLGAQPEKCVNHRDGNKQNNSIYNLEWVTIAQNNSHAIDMGLIDPHKPNDKNRKLQVWDYTTVHALHRHCGMSRKDIAQQNNVSRQTIDKAIAAVDEIMGV